MKRAETIDQRIRWQKQIEALKAKVLDGDDEAIDSIHCKLPCYSWSIETALEFGEDAYCRANLASDLAAIGKTDKAREILAQSWEHCMRGTIYALGKRKLEALAKHLGLELINPEAADGQPRRHGFAVRRVSNKSRDALAAWAGLSQPRIDPDLA
jgi:hypothetical protein